MPGMNRRRTICILLGQIVLVCFALGQAAADQYAPIASALQNKEFVKALELLRPALRESPGNSQLWAMQGAAYAGEGQKKEAVASFQSALKIAPEYIPALEGAIQIEYEDGSRAAIPLLERMLRLRPADQTSHAMLAVLEYQQGNCAVAAIHFEKAGPLLASQLSAQHAYGICLGRLKQFDRAATVFQRAVALDPNDPRERQLLAAVQLMAHKPQDALATLQPLLEIADPDVGVLELAASAYEDAGDTDKAVSSLRQAILREPQNVNLYLDFANICYAHKSFQVGIDVIGDGIALQPKAAALYFARGALYVQLTLYDKAEADFEKAYELDPSQSLSAAARVAAMQSDDPTRALAAVQAKLARTPNDALQLYLQADILSQRGADSSSPDFQLAMRSAQKAVALQPTLGEAREVLAKLYMQIGKYQHAADECRKALARNPKDQTALYRLIQAQQRLGNKAEVPELLKRFAQLREQATKEDRQRNRYKLVEGGTQP